MPHDYYVENLEKARKFIDEAEKVLSNVSYVIHQREDNLLRVELSHCDQCNHSTFDMSVFCHDWGGSDEYAAAEVMDAHCVFCMLFQHGAIAFRARNALIQGRIREAMALMSIPAELYNSCHNVSKGGEALGATLGEQWLRGYDDRHNFDNRTAKAFAEFAQEATELWSRLEEKYDLD